MLYIFDVVFIQVHVTYVSYSAVPKQEVWKKNSLPSHGSCQLSQSLGQKECYMFNPFVYEQCEKIGADAVSGMKEYNLKV